MARVQIATQGWGWVTDNAGNPLSGQSVLIKNTDGSNATHWSAITGGTSTTGAVTTNTNGTIPRYIEEGTYDVTVSGETNRVDAVSGTTIRVIKEAPPNVQYSEYGALADGSTDDTAAFTAALTAVGQGGKIFAPPGVYRVGDLAFTHEGQTIEGAGMGTTDGTILKAKTSATYVLKNQGLRYQEIANLVIDGNTRASKGVLTESTAGATSQSQVFRRVRFYRCSTGFHIGNTGLTQADKNSMYDCTYTENDTDIHNESVNGQSLILVNPNFESNRVRSVKLDGGTLTMYGGMFQGSGGAGSKGVEITGANVEWVSLNDVIFEGPFIDIDGSAAWPAQGVSLRNCVLQGATATVKMGQTGSELTAEYTRFTNGDIEATGNDCCLKDTFCDFTAGAAWVATGSVPRRYRWTINGLDDGAGKHRIGDAGEPTFATNWAHLGSGFEDVTFERTADNRVRIDGSVNATAAQSANATIFTLPAGYRPSASIRRVVGTTAGTINIINVTSGGVVSANLATSSGVALFLGVEFRLIG